MSKKKTHAIDPDQVRMLASFGCTIMDIGKYFQCSESLIRKRYKEAFEAGEQDLKLKLRQKMMRMSLEDGNTATTIFLAKNYLGMSDKTAVDLTGNLETVLKEVGFESNPLDKTNTEQEEALEALGVQPDPAAAGSA